MSRRRRQDVPASSEGSSGARSVIWTQKGEEDFAFSEHGKHKAGETVMTIYADVMVERGFAKETQ